MSEASREPLKHPPRPLPFTLTALVVGGAVAGLLRMPNRTPRTAAGLGDWWQEIGPVAAAFAGLRLLAIGVGLYLLVVLTLTVCARAAGAVTLARTLERLLPIVLRRIVDTTFGATTALSIVVGPITTHNAAPPRSGVPLLVRLADEAPSRPPTTVPTSATAVPTTTTAATSTTARPLPSVSPIVPTSAPTPAPTPTPTATPTPMGTAAAATTWTVARGDHLWSIAETVVTRHDPTSTVADVTRYWVRLIESNRDGLPDPRDPDLILPGMVLVLPPLATPLADAS